MGFSVISILALLSSVSAFSATESFPDLAGQIYHHWKDQLRTPLTDAETAHELARSTYYPSLTLQSSYNDASAEAGIPDTHYGENQIILNQQILNLSQLATIQALESNRQAEELSLEDRLLQLIQESAANFYSLLALKDRELIESKRLSRMTKSTLLLKELSRLKLMDRADAMQSESDQAEAEIAVSQLHLDFLSQTSNLKVLAGMAQTESPSFVDVFDSKIKEPVIDAEQLPSFQSINLRVEYDERSIDSAHWLWAPAVGLSAGYAQYFPVTSNSILPASNGLNVMVTLNFNLFDQGVRFIQAERFEKYRITDEAKRESVSESLKSQIAVAQSRLKLYEKNLAEAQKRVSLAGKAYDASWALFSASKRTFVSLKTVDDSLLDAEIQLSSIRYKTSAQRAILWLWSCFQNGRFKDGWFESCKA
jgi:outer membrane protein TolC